MAKKLSLRRKIALFVLEHLLKDESNGEVIMLLFPQYSVTDYHDEIRYGSDDYTNVEVRVDPEWWYGRYSRKEKWPL